MVFRMYIKRDYKLQSIWRRPVRDVDVKFDLVFLVEDIMNPKDHTVHAQRIVPYAAT